MSNHPIRKSIHPSHLVQLGEGDGRIGIMDLCPPRRFEIERAVMPVRVAMVGAKVEAALALESGEANLLVAGPAAARIRLRLRLLIRRWCG
eukprot:CAMPEP_0174710892 /NCGR_PEP_ID=MMETSP1094-20130205/12374_1 /TAXON_ID=156173 /ORGANISM="Chrysochromulina brevifilum, Strain UTEX LB 985" /LENGTH=90 /DNA_ID=CAMNT_0015909751 /DNA_START=330 /DNA_END=599 /DNA_ORIENTATION=-